MCSTDHSLCLSVQITGIINACKPPRKGGWVKEWARDFSLNTNTVSIHSLLTTSPGLDTTLSKSYPLLSTQLWMVEVVVGGGINHLALEAP